MPAWDTRILWFMIEIVGIAARGMRDSHNSRIVTIPQTIVEDWAGIAGNSDQTLNINAA